MTPVPGNAQHIGDRDSQQDAFGFSNFSDLNHRRHAGVTMVLCDGMGGLANGAAASRSAVDTVLAVVARKTQDDDIPTTLERAVAAAQDAVRAIAANGADAGTTVVAATVWQDRLYWASLGDSRLYLCRDGAPAEQLSEDHTVARLLQRRVARGEIEAAEAERAPDREALTGYLGAPQPAQPDLHRDGVALRPDDRILACSDGVYRALSAADIATIARSAAAPQAAERLIREVAGRALPHQDNMTVVMLHMVAPAMHRAVAQLVSRPIALTGLALLVSGGAFGAYWVWAPPPAALTSVQPAAPVSLLQVGGQPPPAQSPAAPPALPANAPPPAVPGATALPKPSLPSQWLSPAAPTARPFVSPAAPTARPFVSPAAPTARPFVSPAAPTARPFVSPAAPTARPAAGNTRGAGGRHSGPPRQTPKQISTGRPVSAVANATGAAVPARARSRAAAVSPAAKGARQAAAAGISPGAPDAPKTLPSALAPPVPPVAAPVPLDPPAGKADRSVPPPGENIRLVNPAANVTTPAGQQP